MDSDTRLRMADSLPLSPEEGAEDEPCPEEAEEKCEACPVEEAAPQARASSLPPPQRPLQAKTPSLPRKAAQAPSQAPRAPEAPRGSSQAPRGSSQAPRALEDARGSSQAPRAPEAARGSSQAPEAARGSSRAPPSQAPSQTPTPRGPVQQLVALGATPSLRSTEPLRVLLDMDGVLADFEGAALRLWRSTYPEEPFVPLEERRGFYIRRQYDAVREDLGEKMANLYYTPKFFSDMDPIPGAIDAVKEMLTMDNTEVYICTTTLQKFENCVSEKYQWVERYLGSEFVDRVILIKDKTLVNGHLLFDDNDQIKGLMKKPAWEHILVTACHNKNLELLPPLQRLDSWSHDWKAMLERKRQELALY